MIDWAVVLVCAIGYIVIGLIYYSIGYFNGRDKWFKKGLDVGYTAGYSYTLNRISYYVLKGVSADNLNDYLNDIDKKSSTEEDEK